MQGALLTRDELKALAAVESAMAAVDWDAQDDVMMPKSIIGEPERGQPMEVMEGDQQQGQEAEDDEAESETNAVAFGVAGAGAGAGAGTGVGSVSGAGSNAGGDAETDGSGLS